MNKFVAFLRAVNVGGNHIVKMEDLRQMFASLGFENVKTYIQSGNVIFETVEKDADAIAEKIENKLQESLGFEVKTMLRTISELEDIAENNPFDESDDTKIYIIFLSAKPDEKLRLEAEALSTEREIFRIRNRELYVSIGREVSKPLLTNNFTEKRLKVSGTSRNPKTVNKILLLV
jgi:uncharacterized protein (DUF1697 family)